ncbi:hypothetical protein CEE34_09170 [Candidatus Aerophobetes bacterium Ae_b3a]|nr:MAG: hypothetical protein CEE34_09170 [Candidatus Aerophobetes bacterium Ae_b3a]
MKKHRVGPILVTLVVLLWMWISVGMSAPLSFYEDAFRLSTGELIFGELLSFDGSTFKIKTERGMIWKEKEDVVVILVGINPLIYTRTLSQWASKARASSQYSSSGWSAQQATGEPNTYQCGDNSTAWAPRSKGSGAEWLELTFGTPVYVTQLRVYETYNSGCIYKVEFVDVYEEKHAAWQGKDTTTCPGWFEIKLAQTRYLVKSVILHTQIEGYEEIDAVELTGILISK